MPFDHRPERCALKGFVGTGACAATLLLSILACETRVASDQGMAAASSYSAPVPGLPTVDEGAGAAPESERDWAIARETVEWARNQGLATLPIGEVMAILGTSFVGTPYAPGTLEIPGTERLVVNLRVFDCVTLVEHVLVLARLTVWDDEPFLLGEETFRDRYRNELTFLRYRDGVLAGYPSRLHYFSEWIRDADKKGLTRSVSEELGGVEDPRPIRFMTEHPTSYRQVTEDSGVFEAIREMEERVSRAARFFIPEDQIVGREDGIRNGDIIAAVSTLEGLDIAHTGIALWQGDRLHLLHAPLVGDSVEISERPLAERIQGFSSQTGIMVARPIQP